VVQDANPRRCRWWRTVERGREQPPRERRETRGRANELGLGLGACSAGAGLYIGREGRPGSNGHREGWPGSNDHRAWGRAGYWSGPCPCRAGVLGFQPNTGTGGRPGRVVLGPRLIGSCSCRPNELSPFEHLGRIPHTSTCPLGACRITRLGSPFLLHSPHHESAEHPRQSPARL
jgi:hypothetical protein